MSAAAQYVDLQVNGYGGVDYNSDDLTLEAMHDSCHLMREHGVAQFLATIVTDQIPRMCGRLKRIVELRQRDPFIREMIPGFHIEGPFLNSRKGYVGAHSPEAVRPASVDATAQLLEAAGGLTKLLTLAPENDPGFAVTRFLAKQNVVVSAGHTDADLPTLKGAIDAGLSMFTHLGNGCPMEIPRHDNIIQRVLSVAEHLNIGFIADGVHVALFALKNFMKVAELKHSFVVTDAISAAGKGPGMYHLGRFQVMVGEDLAVRAPDGSHLVGSAVTMMREVENLKSIGFSEEEIHDLTVKNPLRAIGM